MPCSLCDSQNEEIKICKDCNDFLKSLKCEVCSSLISLKNRTFQIFCNECGFTNPDELLKVSEEEVKNKINNIIKDDDKRKKEIQKQLREFALLRNKPVYDDKKFIDFYDIILKINSIRDILNGWNIEFSENGKEYYEKMKTKDFLKVGVAGLGNKGKSFLLQKLANIELPSGTSIKTEGLSIKCPDINSENKNIILIDSAGSETPLIEDANFDFNKYRENPKELKEQLDNLARDKSLTESFLQNIIINESNMLLILIGNLTYPEQKLLNKIREETHNKKQNLYVIHNLQTFTERNQVEHYIQDTLLKSATFRLKKNKEIIINSKEGESEENDCYYIEESIQKDNDDSNNVFHLIMAREKTPAGNYYNKFVINFLRNQMNNFPKQSPFPILKKVKDYFFDKSKDYLENPLEQDAFEESEDVIKVKKDTDLKLKKVLVDEMGISNFIGNSYSPKMCYFIFKNKFYFQIELPGKFDKKQFKYNIYVKDKFYIFDIKATKIIGSKNFLQTNNDKRFLNTREEGFFQIRFNILAEDFQFKEKKITQVKPPKKGVEKKKIECKTTIADKGTKEIKEKENEKTLELDEVKAEEGVLTFYVELQETKSEEKGLSDSEDDE